MRYLVIVLLFVLSVTCKNEQQQPLDNPLFEGGNSITEVEIEDILSDSTLSIRAITLFNDGNLGFAGSNNSYGLYDAKHKRMTTSTIQHDSLKLQFRAVANTTSDFFALSIGNPALLFKTGSHGKMELVYKETDENVFYDALHFWNDKEGIAMGDPTDSCISIIITRDGGTTWHKISCENLPKVKDGEAAFAASDTNISIIGNNTWIATGGKSSRILFSPDKGKTWEVFDTPIVQGLETTGMYSVDFYDAQNGFAIGGDYTNPEDASANKIKTRDGGRTWEILGKNQNPGYRSCVQYIPNRAGEELVVLGFNGIDYSKDAGETWTHLSDESFYTVRFLNDSIAYAAGKGRISKLKFLH